MCDILTNDALSIIEIQYCKEKGVSIEIFSQVNNKKSFFQIRQTNPFIYSCRSNIYYLNYQKFTTARFLL